VSKAIAMLAGVTRQGVELAEGAVNAGKMRLSRSGRAGGPAAAEALW
jgi:hypothetical protein